LTVPNTLHYFFNVVLIIVADFKIKCSSEFIKNVN
jgi:hypothetical protein